MMKSATRLKPIAPRPEYAYSQGPNPNAFAGAHLGVAASSLEASVSTNPNDYVWGTPTALPGSCNYPQYPTAAYVCGPGPAAYAQHLVMQHSMSLPNLYSPAHQQQGATDQTRYNLNSYLRFGYNSDSGLTHWQGEVQTDMELIFNCWTGVRQQRRSAFGAHMILTRCCYTNINLVR
jgi:hypothetical protein